MSLTLPWGRSLAKDDGINQAVVDATYVPIGLRMKLTIGDDAGNISTTKGQTYVGLLDKIVDRFLEDVKGDQTGTGAYAVRLVIDGTDVLDSGLVVPDGTHMALTIGTGFLTDNGQTHFIHETATQLKQLLLEALKA
jgi:hypothetical protein